MKFKAELLDSDDYDKLQKQLASNMSNQTYKVRCLSEVFRPVSDASVEQRVSVATDPYSLLRSIQECEGREVLRLFEGIVTSEPPFVTLNGYEVEGTLLNLTAGAGSKAADDYDYETLESVIAALKHLFGSNYRRNVTAYRTNSAWSKWFDDVHQTTVIVVNLNLDAVWLVAHSETDV